MTNSAYSAGQTVVLTNGHTAAINSIKGRWVNVTDLTTDETRNIGFKDIDSLYVAPVVVEAAAESTERKNGVIKASYLDRYAKIKLDNGAVVRDNGDDAAAMLRGLELWEMYTVAAKVLGTSPSALEASYAHLNPGMQRMNVGNRVRKAIRQQAATVDNGL